MATKAELEAELATLREQLANRPARNPEAKAETAPPKADAQTPSENTPLFDWEKELGSVIEELDNFPHKNALLLTLGVFALGFIAGRSR